MAKAKSEVKDTATPRGRKPNPDAQNGVAPPTAKTVSATIWEIADRIHAKGEQPVPSTVIAQVQKKNPEVNVSTIRTQLARWRQFHGMVVPRKAA